MKVIFTALIILLFSSLYGQSDQGSTTIVSDRPGISDSPELVPMKAVQIESGFNYDYQNSLSINNRRFTYNSILLRYRIGKNFELRMQNEYCQFQSLNTTSGYLTKVNSMTPSSVGYKIRISEPKGFKPALSLIGSFNLPYTVKSSIRPTYMGANVKFVAFNAISDKLGLTYNLGAVWDGINPNTFVEYAVCLDYNIYRGISVFGESYGRCAEDAYPHHYSDCGICILVHNNIQFDISGGVIIREQLCNGFLSCGCSMLIFNNHLFHKHGTSSQDDQ